MSFKPADRVSSFSATIFAEIGKLASQYDAIRLSTGYPDTDGPPEAIEAAAQAMRAGHNQYAPTLGEPILRTAIAKHAQRFYGQQLDPETEIAVTNGAAEALYSVCAGLINPGDEVIIIEPYFDVFVPDVLMVGGVPRYVPLRPPRWELDTDELAAAFNARTRAIIVNTPHNPTGKVFSRTLLEKIAELCQEWDVIAIADEVYEHLVYPGATHIRLATLPGMFERTITISSASKTFSFTGWRIGWALGPSDLITALRLAHQYIIDCSATPLQYGIAAALRLPNTYFDQFVNDYSARRTLLMDALQNSGLQAFAPEGGYFILADFAELGFDDDVEFCRHLIREVGVATIPPSVFFSKEHRHLGQKYIRFAFCKTPELLEQAGKRLVALQNLLDR